MSRRLYMLITALLIVSLSGCVILPEHRHCCWRYYGAADTHTSTVNS
jgi:cytochrome c biogenesis protein ResB